MILCLVTFFEVIKTFTIPLTMFVPARSTGHDCSSCFDTRNFRKLGFNSRKLGLKRSVNVQEPGPGGSSLR